MQMPLQITMRNFRKSEALNQKIRERAAQLEQFHSHITSCRVTVEEQRLHKQQGREFTVKIDLRVPRHREIVVTRDHHEDVYVALRDAFDAAKRQLDELAHAQRGEVKQHELQQHGRIARLVLDEGFGFIEAADGRELYFSRENVVHPLFEQLAPGTAVQFIEALDGDGPQAKRVSAGKHGS